MSVDQLTDRARCSRLTADVALTACVILCDGSQCLLFVLFCFLGALTRKNGIRIVSGVAA